MAYTSPACRNPRKPHPGALAVDGTDTPPSPPSKISLLLVFLPKQQERPSYPWRSPAPKIFGSYKRYKTPSLMIQNGPNATRTLTRSLVFWGSVKLTWPARPKRKDGSQETRTGARCGAHLYIVTSFLHQTILLLVHHHLSFSFVRIHLVSIPFSFILSSVDRYYSTGPGAHLVFITFYYSILFQSF